MACFTDGARPFSRRLPNENAKDLWNGVRLLVSFAQDEMAFQVDALQFRDGRQADGPIALSEVQGYAYQAARETAELFDAYGEPGGQALRDFAETLQQNFRERFWVTAGYSRRWRSTAAAFRWTSRASTWGTCSVPES